MLQLGNSRDELLDVGLVAERVRGDLPVENERGSLRTWSAQPTVLTLQDLLDLPRQVLPEQTYFHLRNAGREAILAVVSLVNSLSSSRRSPEDDKVRRRIDVE